MTSMKEPPFFPGEEWIPVEIVDPFLFGSLHCSGIGRKQLSSNQTVQTVLERELPFWTGERKKDYFLCAVLSGCCEAVLDSCPSPLSEGDAFLFAPGSPPVLMASGQPCDICFVFLGGNLSEQYFSRITDTFGSTRFAGAAQAISGEIFQMLHSHSLSMSFDDCTVSLSAYRILLELYRQSNEQEQNQYPPLILSALQIMRENFAYLYGIDEVAETLEVSKSYFIRAFTKYMGISPGKYLTQLRIENAKLYLLSGEYPVEVVANMSGYSDANYFCKVFKKSTGLTPRKFAEQNPQAQKRAFKPIDHSEGFVY